MTSKERIKKILESKKDDSKILSFSGPFETLSRKEGRLNLLKDIGSKPEEAALRLLLETEHILNSISLRLKKESGFDAAWMWSDLAYKDNLFFSIEFYKKYLFPVHKKIIAFLNSQDMPVIFHSDGKIEKLIPYLLEAGIAALHPLDTYADMDIAGLRKRYGAELVFFEA